MPSFFEVTFRVAKGDHCKMEDIFFVFVVALCDIVGEKYAGTKVLRRCIAKERVGTSLSQQRYSVEGRLKDECDIRKLGKQHHFGGLHKALQYAWHLCSY